MLLLPLPSKQAQPPTHNHRAPHPPTPLVSNSLAPTLTSPGMTSYRGGGGGLRAGKFSPWDISRRVYFACTPEFAVGNFAPICCEPTFGWWWLLLLADALQLSPRGWLFLPNELLVAGCCYFMVVVLISWWLLVFSDALLLPFHPCKAQYSALRPRHCWQLAMDETAVYYSPSGGRCYTVVYRQPTPE